MASSNSASSSLPIGRWTHDVFLSFRGEDTRTNFVDHLYAALVHRGVDTFKDDEMLRRGELISPELLKAIEGSRFAVVVFSENYANSSWCLDELAKIMECRDRMGQKVLPVFYHVDPSDLRGQKGKFTTALQQKEEKFRGEMEKLTKWREALVTASKISGWHVADNVGESKFIDKIVQEILGGIQPQSMETNLIGIESHMDALNSLLCTEAIGDARIIGIWGMGGIGKTTIAQALFRRIAYKFEGSSFVKDVRENSCSKRDICALQEKILRDILMTPQTFMNRDPHDGVGMMCRSFSNKKVLLVLDDVDNVNQLEFLAATHEWFGPGSRIIITTRDEHLLADAHFKYKPSCLLIDQAVELFSRHAFQKNNPPKEYEDLSYRAISYTGYLPLALKVLGSFFRGRQASVWESALNRLAKAPNSEIFEAMKLSFDGLDVSEKNIFLDIACFFKGKDKEHATRILDSFGFEPVIGISVLIEKSLITVLNEKLGMHDLIQEMGWEIVRRSFSDSRLWEPEEIHDVRNRKLKVIEAIVLPDNNMGYLRKKLGLSNALMPIFDIEYHAEKLGFSDEVFRKMKNLRLLDIDRTCISCEPTFLPDKLRWLRWHHYPFSSLPVEHMRKLVGLEMFGGSIKDVWKGQKILPNLKFVEVSNNLDLTKFPDVSGAPNIERLILSYCQRLVEVHESLGCHRRLAYLDMSGCQHLKCLPSRIEMESLETLILSKCLCLERFPEVAPSMVKLSDIYLDDCIRIEELPSSIRYLSGLSYLNMTSCQNLKNIPNSICELKNLKSLHLDDCNELQHLPEKLGSMEKLEELSLGYSDWWKFGTLKKSIRCHALTSLCSLRKLDLSWRPIEEEDFPQDFQVLSSLEELHLSGNSQLTQLPAGISCLSKLKLLELNNCCRLQNLQALPSQLQVLRARGCSSLEKIGDISQEYEWLYKAWFIDCHKLLEDKESERYIDKILQESFLKKCASVNHRLSIAVPGSKVPSWFKEQQHGCDVALRLLPKLHTQIMGFAICGVFHGDWKYGDPRIIFKIVNDEKVIPKSEVDHIDSCAADHNCNLWVTYIPFGFFQQMYPDFQPQDWSNIEGNLVMTVMRTDRNKAVNCGANIVYKEDVELIQQLKTCISDFGNLMQVDGDDHHGEVGYKGKVSANTYVYEEKSYQDSEKSVRTKALQNQNVYNRPVIYTQGQPSSTVIQAHATTKKRTFTHKKTPKWFRRNPIFSRKYQRHYYRIDFFKRPFLNGWKRKPFKKSPRF